MPLHEIGHATASWLAGWPAVPLPLLTARMTAGRSMGLGLATSVALVVAVVLARKRGHTGVAVAIGALAVVQAVVAFALPEGWVSALIAWSGQGGEILLPTALTLPLLAREGRAAGAEGTGCAALGVAQLLMATWSWVATWFDRSRMPWGAALGALGFDGDLDILRDVYGWTEDGLVASYLVTAAVCWIAAVGISVGAAREG
jgi:hypothetical protein